VQTVWPTWPKWPTRSGRGPKNLAEQRLGERIRAFLSIDNNLLKMEFLLQNIIVIGFFPILW
jgi:hypothetical protein